MASLAELYNSRLNLARSVESRVMSVLFSYAIDNGFLVSGRTKTLESMEDKLQSGRYSSFFEIDDFVAFSIIIDTRSQENEVISFIKRVFDVQFIRKQTAIRDENHFGFDCTRLYANLSNLHTGMSSPSFLFEIQIRTLLQHAWSKITHAEVYKPPKISSQKTRLASELMANIEGLDRVFSTFSTTSRHVRRIPQSRIEQPNYLIEMYGKLITDNLISKEFSAKNTKRLAENVVNLLEKRENFDVRNAASAIELFVKGEGNLLPTSISLYEIALVALSRASLLKRKHKPYYVSSELISIYPEMKKHSPIVEFPDTL